MQFELQTNAESEYWLLKNKIDESTCKRIISLGENKWTNAKIMQDNSSSPTLDEKVRITDTYFSKDNWLYQMCWDFMKIANRDSCWNFEVSACENMQVTRYREKGHYDFHYDGNGFTKWNKPYDIGIHGKTRKLSMTILLNEDYEGGEFEFFNYDNLLIKEKMGTIIVFPSYLLHRVRPVTSGVRYSLVAWFNGQPFK